MKTLRFISGVLALVAVLGFTTLARATNSSDGASITPASGGSLITSAGTWTFSTTTGSGGNDILLNGTWVNARGIQLTVGNGGQMYNFSASSHWYVWGGSSFGSALASTPFPISANNTNMLPGGSTDLVTVQGIWAFSTATGSGGNIILLNGVQANGGSAKELFIQNGGQVYQENLSNAWYVWYTANNTWTPTTNPNVPFSAYCTSGVVVGLQWTAVSGATKYNVTRGATTVVSGTMLRAATDKGVTQSTTYPYVLTALNSSGGTVSTQNLSVTTPPFAANGDPAYCPSSSIAGIVPNWSAGITQANGSDLWSQTLGSDGQQYGFFGDGGGFGGSNSPYVSFGIGAITDSTPGTISDAVNVYGGINTEHAATIGGKATGILEIGPSSAMDFYALAGTKTCSTNPPSTCKGGSNNQNIVYSTGNAWTWTDNASNWTFCTASGPTGNFCPGAFLQNGSGYSGNTDGYVYLYGTTQGAYYGDPPAGTAANTYLWRVPKAQASILSSTAYQAFTGYNADGTPAWTPAESFTLLNTAMRPVFVDSQQGVGSGKPLPMGISAITYNAALGRYIASAETLINQVAFYDAPNPWGPWTTIGFYHANPTTNNGGWGNFGNGISWGASHGDGLGVNFIDKWMSSNGQTMWVVSASDGLASSSASLTAIQGKDMDAFTAVPLTVYVF
jgi:hypothetical protein